MANTNMAKGKTANLYTDAILSDYGKVMGVPISFLDRYCPGQFEIIWRNHGLDWAENRCAFYKKTSRELTDRLKAVDRTLRDQIPYYLDEDGTHHNIYDYSFAKSNQYEDTRDSAARAVGQFV